MRTLYDMMTDLFCHEYSILSKEETEKTRVDFMAVSHVKAWGEEISPPNYETVFQGDDYDLSDFKSFLSLKGLFERKLVLIWDTDIPYAKISYEDLFNATDMILAQAGRTFIVTQDFSYIIYFKYERPVVLHTTLTATSDT